MKLVSTHKQIVLFLFSLIIFNTLNAQVWSLNQCVDTAQIHNKSLQIARNNMDLSLQKEKEAKSNLLPKLIANAEYKYFTDLPYQLMPLSTFNPAAAESQFKEAQFGVPHNINVNLQLAIPLYNPQMYGGIKASRIASEIAQIQYLKNEEQIYFEIANLYYNIQILSTQNIFIDSNIINSKQLLANLNLLHRQLLATGTDVGKVELQLEQLKIQKQTVNSKIEQLKNALKLAMGINTTVNLEIESSINYPSKNNYNPLISLDSRMVNSQIQLLDNEIKTLKKSSYLPSLNLIGSYGTTGFGYDQKPNDFLKFFPIGFAGIQLSYPIFNGTTNLRKINQKQIELQNNRLKSSHTDDQYAVQILNAELQRSVNYQSIETSKFQIGLAQKIYNNTILLKKQGLASLTEVLMADNALREAQQTHLSAIIDYLKADLELKRLSGHLKNQ